MFSRSIVLVTLALVLAVFAPVAQALSITASGPLVACQFIKLRFEDAYAPIHLKIEDGPSGEVEEMTLMNESGAGWFVDMAPNMNVTITITDSYQNVAVLPNQFIRAGDDDSCYTWRY